MPQHHDAALLGCQHLHDVHQQRAVGVLLDGVLDGGRLLIVATTLELLREHGPAGPAFWRFGCEDRQKLWDAIGNPRRDAALARRAGDARRRLAQEAAEREAQRPVCAACGTKFTEFTDDRWKDSIAVDWGRGDSHPHLCDDCKTRALEAERQAEQAERERQEQERQETEAAPASKAAGCSDAGAADPGNPSGSARACPGGPGQALVVGGGCEVGEH
ncbi:hypothetical protein [Streptomyces sp. NPDC054834]